MRPPPGAFALLHNRPRRRRQSFALLFILVESERTTRNLNVRLRKRPDTLLLGAMLGLAAAHIAAGPSENYAKHCAACHDKPADAKTPDTDAIRRMNSVRLRHSLERGKMRQHASAMRRGEVRALADYLAAGQQDRMPQSAFCPGNTPVDEVELGHWGFDAANSRWQRGGAATPPALELKWAFGVPGVSEMRAQVAVTNTTIYLPTVSGRLYALDRETGCIRWTYQSDRPLRTAATLGKAGNRPALFVGDGSAFIHAVDAANGERIWETRAALFDASMATGAPVQHGDRLFVPVSAFGVALAMRPQYPCCKSHGGVRALDAATGKVLWTAHMTEDAKPTYKNSVGTQMWGPSGAAVWTSPAIDAKRGVLYIGTGENTSSPATELSDAIVALDMASGEVKWHFQGTKGDAFNMACGRPGVAGASCPKENGPDFDFGASVVIARNSAGKDVLLAGQKSGEVFALDPDKKGEVIWRRRLSPGSALGGVHWGIAADETQVYVPIGDPPSVRERRPGVQALRIDDGADVWRHVAERDCVPSRSADAWPDCPPRYEFSAAVSIVGGVVLAGGMDGRIFALDRKDGRVRWSYATNRYFDTVNGMEAHGGSIDNAGVVAAGRTVIAQSGYGLFFGMPGNALLVFAPAAASSAEAL